MNEKLKNKSNNRLEVNICDVVFKNPIITASGTYGYGLEYENVIDLNMLGGICVKGLSLNPVYGNPYPRIVETTGGLLNAIGLQNIGVNAFIQEKLPLLKKYDTKIIANFWGTSLDEYVQVAEILNDSDVDMLEMNISCPNIKAGGLQFGVNPKMTETVVAACKKVVTKKPLIVKLSPNVTNIGEFATICEASGADAISAINTLTGMSIDIDTRKPKLANNIGGLSGAAIKPIAIERVYRIFQNISIPIFGMGGIFTYKDVIEFFLAGSSAVSIGTLNFINPEKVVDIVYSLEQYCIENSIDNIGQLKGGVRINNDK